MPLTGEGFGLYLVSMNPSQPQDKHKSGGKSDLTQTALFPTGRRHLKTAKACFNSIPSGFDI